MESGRGSQDSEKSALNSENPIEESSKPIDSSVKLLPVGEGDVNLDGSVETGAVDDLSKGGVTLRSLQWLLYKNDSLVPRELRIPVAGDTVENSPEGFFSVYRDYFRHGLTLPIPSWLSKILKGYNIAFVQLSPKSIMILYSLREACNLAGVDFNFELVSTYHWLHYVKKGIAQYTFYGYFPKLAFVKEFPSNFKEWKTGFFYVRHIPKTDGEMLPWNEVFPTTKDKYRKPKGRISLIDEVCQKLLPFAVPAVKDDVSEDGGVPKKKSPASSKVKKAHAGNAILEQGVPLKRRITRKDDSNKVIATTGNTVSGCKMKRVAKVPNPSSDNDVSEDMRDIASTPVSFDFGATVKTNETLVHSESIVPPTVDVATPKKGITDKAGEGFPSGDSSVKRPKRKSGGSSKDGTKKIKYEPEL